MDRHKVANIEEAVELANDLKTKGLYNWFRGQVGEWPPHSSLYRIQAGGRRKEEIAYRGLSMFCKVDRRDS